MWETAVKGRNEGTDVQWSCDSPMGAKWGKTSFVFTWPSQGEMENNTGRQDGLFFTLEAWNAWGFCISCFFFLPEILGKLTLSCHSGYFTPISPPPSVLPGTWWSKSSPAVGRPHLLSAQTDRISCLDFYLSVLLVFLHKNTDSTKLGLLGLVNCTLPKLQAQSKT